MPFTHSPTWLTCWLLLRHHFHEDFPSPSRTPTPTRWVTPSGVQGHHSGTLILLRACTTPASNCGLSALLLLSLCCPPKSLWASLKTHYPQMLAQIPQLLNRCLVNEKTHTQIHTQRAEEFKRLFQLKSYLPYKETEV